MAVDLQKGQKVRLSKESPGEDRFTVGLGWDVKASDTGSDFDLDCSAFLLGANEKIFGENYFVFYNNLSSPDGSVLHTGDNRTGAGDGDDESLNIDFSKINPEVEQILFVVTIHNADENRQNFGQVRNAYIRVLNASTGQEILKYELDEDFSIETAITFGRFYRREGQWSFEATGTGLKGGLEAYLQLYS